MQRKQVFKFFLCLLLLPVYLVAFLLPRDRNLWIFGSWDGQVFNDNSKYLFLYIAENHSEIRAIWLSHRDEIIKDLTNKGYEAYQPLSIKGFLYSLRASCVVISNCLGDVNGFAIGKAKKIQLWHGTPLKKIGYDSGLGSISGYRVNNRLRAMIVELVEKVSPFTVRRYDLLAAASEEAKRTLGSGFRDNKDRLRVTGYPRNDALFDTVWLASNRCDYIERSKNEINFKYVITYLPTHRQLGKKQIDLFAGYGFDSNEAQRMLEGLNAILIIKAHYFDRGDDMTARKSSSQRIYAPSSDEVTDIYPILKETDILITDYSSIYFDYLLLNRPIIFTPFDIEEYSKEEGFYYDYDEVTPGPKAKDWPEVLKLIEEVIQNDRWERKREAVCGRFNGFRDNMSSQRVFEAIRKTLREERRVRSK